MCSDAFKPVPVKDADGKEVEGLMQIQSQKVNKVCAVWTISGVVSSNVAPKIVSCVGF